MAGFGKIPWGSGPWGGRKNPVLEQVREDFSNLSAFIRAAVRSNLDISATISSLTTKDISASAVVTQPQNIGASAQPIPGYNLPTLLQTIPGMDLRAFGGGHPPEDITGSLYGVAPKDIPAYIIGGYSGLKDLSASITRIGEYDNLPVFVRGYTNQTKDISAKLLVRFSPDLPATIRGWVEEEIAGSLHAWHEKYLRAIVTGRVEEQVSNIKAHIRRSDSGVENLPVESTRAVVSTHTNTRKVSNLNKVLRPFYQNKYAFGSKGGLFFLNLEPVFGDFPDIHGEIAARQFFTSDVKGFLRGYNRDPKDLSTSVVGVVPYININKLTLSLTPLINLGASLYTSSGFKELRTLIRSSRSVSTGTSSTAGYSTKATSYRFYLGTTRGLFIPPQLTPEIKVTVYRNDHPLPDLHGYIRGWVELNLLASIKGTPFTNITGSLRVLDISYISELSVSLIPARLFDLTASLEALGSLSDLVASISTSSSISNISAIINSYITPLGIDVVAFSTKPFKDLGAIINYGQLVNCAPTSAFKDMSALLRAMVSGDSVRSDLSAEIDVLRVISDLPTEVIARTRSRVRILRFDWRASTRTSESLFVSITPLVSTVRDLAATVVGMSHEFDITASLSVVRLSPHKVATRSIETAVNFKNTTDIKNILITFRSQVSSYVYEDVTSSVYAREDGEWAIDLRTLLRDESFYDRSSKNKVTLIDDLTGFNSLDEAIRNALVILTEGRSSYISAQLQARGAISTLMASVSTVSSDRFVDFSAKISAMLGDAPDLAASINTGLGSSGFSELLSIVSGTVGGSADLTGAASGILINDLSAEILAI